MPSFEQLSTSELIVFIAYICIAGLTLIGLMVYGVIMAKISSGKFRKSCKIISDFANESGVINDANLEQFEATCLDNKTNATMLEGWEAFKAARFGYPSEYIDKEKVLSHFDSKKFKTAVIVSSLVVFLISVIVAVFAIITIKDSQYTLLFAIIAMILPLIPMPCYLPAKPKKKAEVAFDQTMDDLDTAVQLQNYVERSIDNTRLLDIQNRIKNIILSEQSKPIPSKKDQLEKRKAMEASVVAEKSAFAEEVAEVDAPEEETMDDLRAELLTNDEPVEYNAEEDLDELDEEEPEEEPEEPVEEEIVDSADEKPNEEQPEELIDEQRSEEKSAPKKPVKFEPFVSVLNQVIDADYPTATLKKIAKILVLAFGKFKEPEQREALKNSIRRFIVSYKAAAAREAEETATDAEDVYVADTAEMADDENEMSASQGTMDDYEERKNEIAAMGGNVE